MIALLLLLALVLPWVTSYAEWWWYGHNAVLLGRRAWGWSELPLLWLFYAKTQVVLLPVVALALGLAAVRWINTAQIVLLLGLGLTLAWVAVDAQMYARTQIHALSYLRFLGDPQALQWAGSMRGLRYAIGSSIIAMGKPLLLAALATLIVLRAAEWLLRRLLHDRERAARWLAWAAGALYLAALLGVAPAQYLAPDRITLLRAHALLPFDMTWTAPGLQLPNAGQFAAPLNKLLGPVLRDTMPMLRNGAPADQQAFFHAEASPNVLLLVMESLRADSLQPSVMPRLSAIASGAMQLRQHRSGARITHLGLYSLLFARSPAFYFPTTDAEIEPQACVSFSRSGYRTSYLASATDDGWLNMQRYLNGRFFDQISESKDPDWPAADARTLERARHILRDRPRGKPQFVVAFLTSTHFPYEYPPRFESRHPVLGPDWQVLPFDPARDLAPLVNRYHNACGFLDHLVGDFLGRIDLSNTIVAITGDHGESLWDDGALTHGGRWSDSQMRVPCVILGAGVHPCVIDDPTNHMDLLPTLLHLAAGKHVAVRNISGRDLLSDEFPAPRQSQLLSAESHEPSYEMLMSVRGRRLLLEFPRNQFAVKVRGSVDPMGNIRAFDFPPASDAGLWARAISQQLRRLTECRPAEVKP